MQKYKSLYLFRHKAQFLSYWIKYWFLLPDISTGINILLKIFNYLCMIIIILKLKILPLKAGIFEQFSDLPCCNDSKMEVIEINWDYLIFQQLFPENK